ncbi:polysaccharide biosynthesis protein [Anianabacter salinae]|uniref:polysaccharide biosynthesis protein n=1 Tax=Anianabacter salinae TaxID=2851023 RepID=UPI00225E10D5|nr:nucleoside-diphosphate sugar epimerase/dehydratase [Anianabacter salinae]MBV0914125.1 polysaccharide biosynthesis protein [Anianabacter salinae]
MNGSPLLKSLGDLPRATKRWIIFSSDLILIVLCLYGAFALRFGVYYPFPRFIPEAWVLLVLVPLAGIPVMHWLRLSHIRLHAMEPSALINIAAAGGLISAMAMIFSYYLQIPSPRSVPIIFATLFFMSATLIRLGAVWVIAFIGKSRQERTPVLIYGAGAAGMQLASSLMRSREVRPVAFVDGNPSLRGLLVGGLTVHPTSRIGQLVAEHGVRVILIAIPSLNAARRAAIVQELSRHNVEVKVLPSYIDLMSGKGLVESLRTVTPDDLLGRDGVVLNQPEIAKAYAGRVVMVTGAGGAIGSELCRQLLACNPSKIVLFEQGEYALYAIDAELRKPAADTGAVVVTRLGSITNKARVTSVLRDEGVEIVLHAAAYKHVPIVEDNELEGSRNNVLGTQVVAEAAREARVERFILISTDKAVRPTNIMGATKRMAELVVQDIQTRSPVTKYAMVRFGNVLGSSGSVLPLFQRQIAAGGPVTVTHPDVTRFFMTIPEAARLVLLAGAYAHGGDVFVLDMGEPRRIMDIARKMIELSGCTVKESGAEDGDIEIVVTGLRPGEKLYEELLIDDDSLVATPHAKILRAAEKSLSQIEVAAMLKELERAITDGDSERLRSLIESRVDGYRRPSEALLTDSKGA